MRIEDARNQARDELKGRLPEYVNMITKPSKGRNMYNCPLPNCGSGTGPKKTGAFQIKEGGTSWECYACGHKGDIFDLIGEVERIPDYNGRLKRACQIFGVEIQKPDKNEAYTATHTHTQAHTQQQKAAPEDYTEDYSTFFLQAHANIKNTDYAAKRGLTEKTIDRFNIGFVENWKHPKPTVPDFVPGKPVLIIPINKRSYLARDTRPNIPEDQQRFKKQQVGSKALFNIEALETAKKPTYVTEGEIDALSIIEAGGEAIALGSAGQWSRLVTAAKEKKPKQPLIIALDNDSVGQARQEELLKALAEAQIEAYAFNPCLGEKDANEALVKHGREALAAAVAEGEAIKEALLEEERELYINKTSAAGHIAEFLNGVKASADTPPTETGFPLLDKCMDGGLYEGLYAIGALPSLGKTTLIMQVCDQIAQAGGDVLIFSLEMARTELMAKSISRHTYQIIEEEGGKVEHAKTTRGITTGARYKFYSKEEKELITKAVMQYSQYAGRVFIIEGVGDIGTDEIRAAIKEHIRLSKGRKPAAIVIDYLQIIAPTDPHTGDKQNVDKAIIELKRLSRDEKLPIIAISSVNRANYSQPINLSAFKESGGIEFSCDTVIGLQLKGVGSEGFNVDKEKSKMPREIELVILKNRNGRTGDKLYYEFYPQFNFYTETGMKEREKGRLFKKTVTGTAAADNEDLIEQLRGRK